MKGLFVATTLAALLAGVACADAPMYISAQKAKELYGTQNVVFVSGDNDDVYRVGHIKGSVGMDAHHLHHSDIVGHMHCAPLYMCPDEAAEHIGKKGIDNDTYVVAYDDYKGPNASGVYHYFKLYGHKNVSIVNGGMAQLKALGIPVEKGDEPKVAHKNYKVDEKNINWDILVSKEDMKKAVDDLTANPKGSKYVIIDTRRMAEIIGSSKLDNVARGGHVPYSKFVEWSNFSDAEKKLSLKEKKALEEVLDRNGITKDKTIYTYCHVGAGRSSYIWSVLKELGYENVKVYTGSWDEWGNDFNMPIRR
jgi:thiosulfate/3-mercaptopyruvate sulfurtransferase